MSKEITQEQKIYKILHKKYGFVLSNKSKNVKFVEEKLENGEPSPKGAMFFSNSSTAKEYMKMMVTGSYGVHSKFQTADFKIVPFTFTKIQSTPETPTQNETTS
jgi:exoribonuclease II